MEKSELYSDDGERWWTRIREPMDIKILKLIKRLNREAYLVTD